jgi:hypothetical protein
MKQKIRGYSFKNKNELIDKLKQIWNEIPQDFTAKLVASMDKRIHAVIKAKGNHTKY